jgi:hypothetical protein
LICLYLDFRRANSDGSNGELTQPITSILVIRAKSNPAGKEYGGVAGREKGETPTNP